MEPLAGRLERFEDASSLARAAADSLAELARSAVEERGRFSVALTGGSSPLELYRLLARPEWTSRFQWDRVHLFWGDDRCVPPGHPRSNYGPAHELFISQVPIPAGNVHRIRGELRPVDAAAAYAEELEAFFGSGTPEFDLVHLGLGDDGHIASLFPFDLQGLGELRRTVLTTLRLPEGEPRVTLPYRVINAARRVEFLLPDRTKSRIARVAMSGPLDPFRIPAQAVRPRGELVWLSAL